MSFSAIPNRGSVGARSTSQSRASATIRRSGILLGQDFGERKSVFYVDEFAAGSHAQLAWHSMDMFGILISPSILRVGGHSSF